MKLNELKSILKQINQISFLLPDHSSVPAHFHVTEVGSVVKNFIDCGGTVRTEKTASLQLWTANDLDHRLSPSKLIEIIELSEKHLGLENQEIEVEYQPDITQTGILINTVSKFGLDFQNGKFMLTAKKTDCLASDKCGVPPVKQKVALSDLNQTSYQNTCKPGSGCC